MLVQKKQCTKSRIIPSWPTCCRRKASKRHPPLEIELIAPPTRSVEGEPELPSSSLPLPFPFLALIFALAYRCTFGPGLMGRAKAQKKKHGPDTLFSDALSSSCVVYLIKLPFLFCILSFFIRVFLLNRLKQKRHHWSLSTVL
jgi:hypothetical protein